MSSETEPRDLEEHERVFLVVVDDSEEMRTALRFACRRAEHTRGRVALLEVIEPVEFQHWIGVGRVMEEEARQEAEQRVQALASEVFDMSGRLPAIYIREGNRAEELLSLIDEDPTISLLVLGVAEGKGGSRAPGELPDRQYGAYQSRHSPDPGSRSIDR